MIIVKPKHFDSVTTNYKNIVYHKNESESLWIRGSPYPNVNLVSIFRTGFEDWIWVEFEEYEQIRTFLDLL